MGDENGNETRKREVAMGEIAFHTCIPACVAKVSLWRSSVALRCTRRALYEYEYEYKS